MKILFLDMDGVCNSAEYMQKRRRIPRPTPHAIDAQVIPHLNEILRRSGAKIVISSTWRKNPALTVERFNEIFKAHGIDGEVIDKTPSIYYAREGYVMGVEAPRGHEILHWLCENTGRVSGFAILDDNSDMEPLMDRLVQTDWETGLLAEHVEPVVAMLEKAFFLPEADDDGDEG